MKKRSFLKITFSLLVCTSLSFSGFAQKDSTKYDKGPFIIYGDPELDTSELFLIEGDIAEKKVDQDQVFIVVEQMPEFPGGQLKLRQFIARNIEYPNIARKNGIQEKIYVKFSIEKDGSVKNIFVVRGKNKHLCKAAMEVVEKLPNFKPGLQRGEPVVVWYTVPVNFKLD